MIFVLFLLISLCIADPVHPMFPDHTYYEGSFNCPQVGPGCVGIITGMARGWWNFDSDGNILNYREDAILGDGVHPILYNREYSTPTLTKEFSLTSFNETKLVCFIYDIPYQPFNSKFPKAKYIGQTTYNGKQAYEWQVFILSLLVFLF